MIPYFFGSSCLDCAPDGSVNELRDLLELRELEIGHKILFSCCALWAQVIPKLVGRAAGPQPGAQSR